MAFFGVSPKDTLIIEDSEVGLASAYASCANVMKVDGPQDIIYEKIVSYGERKYLERL
jgi:beta-phosphoglucomutase-like phosphatase (HAD superfamily)